MASKSYYHRSFIILKAEGKGYGFIPNKEPAGYCKFEIRRGIGKAYIYVQDIKPSSSLNGVYEAYLISADSTVRPCKLASLHVDEQGRGEHIASFDANDIMGTGYSLENFHALVVAFRSGPGGRGMRIAYPLIGYSGRNINIDIHGITESLKVIHGEGIEMESEPEITSEDGTESQPEIVMETEEEPEIPAQPVSEQWSIDEIPAKPEPEAEHVPEVAIESQLEMAMQPESNMESEVPAESERDPEPVDEVFMELEPEAEPEIRSESERVPEAADEVFMEPEPEAEPEITPESEREPEPAEEVIMEVEPVILTEDEPESQPETATQPQWESALEMDFKPLSTYPGQVTQYGYGEEISPKEVYKSDEEEFRRTEEDIKRAYEDSYQGYLHDLEYQDRMYSYSSATYWDNVKDYFAGLFKAHGKVYPFDNELKNAEWIRIQQSVAGPNGYYTETPYRYPYYNNTYPDHYIIGLIKDSEKTKYVIYGIPSMYSMIPPISINGFSRWVPIKDGYGLGYWLLYIDAMDGRVVYPSTGNDF